MSNAIRLRPLLTASLMFVAWAVPTLAQDTSGIDADIYKGRPYSPYADQAFPTEVYFGDTHVHTGLSPDAGGLGTTLMPRDGIVRVNRLEAPGEDT